MRGTSILRTMLAAGSVTTLAALPPFLLSAQSVLMKRDLDFNEAQLGFAVSGFFAAAAVTSLSIGGLLDRVGLRAAVPVFGALAALSALGTGLLASGFLILLACLMLAGIANAGLQLTANLTVAQTLPVDHQGIGYGIKQSAIPFSILIGGLAVPTVAVTVGWRWTYVVLAGGAALVVVAGLRSPKRMEPGVVPVAGHGSPAKGALLVTFVAMSVASIAVNSLGAFLPAWAFESGMSPVGAAVLLSAASAASILMRVVSGAAADRRARRHLPVVALHLTIGAAGVVGIASGHPLGLIGGALIAFAFGWGWPGLLIFAVIRATRDRPAVASTAVQAGAFVGGASGPALFGLLVTAADYATAWLAVAAAMVLSAGLLMIARQMFLDGQRRRSPPTA